MGNISISKDLVWNFVSVCLFDQCVPLIIELCVFLNIFVGKHQVLPEFTMIINRLHNADESPQLQQQWKQNNRFHISNKWLTKGIEIYFAIKHASGTTKSRRGEGAGWLMVVGCSPGHRRLNFLLTQQQRCKNFLPHHSLTLLDFTTLSLLSHTHKRTHNKKLKIQRLVDLRISHSHYTVSVELWWRGEHGAGAECSRMWPCPYQYRWPIKEKEVCSLWRSDSTQSQHLPSSLTTTTHKSRYWYMCEMRDTPLKRCAFSCCHLTYNIPIAFTYYMCMMSVEDDMELLSDLVTWGELYLDHWESGGYSCSRCKNLLYRSEDKWKV